MARIDLAATVGAIDFPPEIWAWLDVLGKAVKVTDAEARRRDAKFVAESPYTHVIQRSVHFQLAGIKAVYALLRYELVAQAAAQARLVCESIITLRYIAEDPNSRSSAFLDYAIVEAYESIDSMIRWDGDTAIPEVMAQIKRIRDDKVGEYEQTVLRYQFVDSKGRTRRFKNWANRSLADMSVVSPKCERLYDLIYRQLSSYVHGTSWSLRHLTSYSLANYDVKVALADIAQVTMATLAIWQVVAEFLKQELDWDLSVEIDAVLVEVSRLQRVEGIAPRGGGA
jgi:hypothetical protein